MGVVKIKIEKERGEQKNKRGIVFVHDDVVAKEKLFSIGTEYTILILWLGVLQLWWKLI